MSYRGTYEYNVRLDISNNRPYHLNFKLCKYILVHTDQVGSFVVILILIH